MDEIQNHAGIEKLQTYIPGFDLISEGGVPKGRTTLIAGTSGSAKTVFTMQFLAAGIINADEGAVFITFEEHPADIRQNVKGIGWDIQKWEDEGKFAFVDASPDPGVEITEIGNYELDALLARIKYAVKKVNARRVGIDSLGAIFSQFHEAAIVRRELFKIITALREMGVTSLLTTERTQEYGDVGRYGVEEFVVDDVIILRNVLDFEKRRRTIEILKFRGTSHHKGEYPFTIIPSRGIEIIPLSGMQLTQKSSNTRISSGSSELDAMCGGGFFRDSIILLSGATGCGKTLMVAEFMRGAIKNDDRCMIFAFEESREQLFRNASGWGIDFKKMDDKGNLKVICAYPEVAGLEDHLIKIKMEIEAFKPQRVAIDSLSALERVSNEKSFREFVISLTSFIKEKEIAGVLTSTTETLMGGSSVTEAHISSITDAIVLLRYVEMWGELKRAITVLKMRGSLHDKDIREVIIDGDGMHIGNPFRGVTGILSGAPQYITPSEVERIDELFKE
jgi:circadian clock protein KaiC